MQPEAGLQLVPPAPPGNVGDVLASIRRLIALEASGPTAPDCADPPLVLAQGHQIAPARDDCLSPEDEAELAEAEAVLARMIAPRHPPAPASPPEAGEADTASAGRANLFIDDAGDAASGLHDLIRDALRHELEGEMGARFSRNLHRLVRQEVEAVLRELCADR